MAEVQKTYNEALDQIAKDTQKRIDVLKEKLKELAKTLSDLGAKQAGIDAIKNAPIYTAPTAYAQGGRIDSAGNYNAFNPAMVGMTSGGVNITQNISYPTATASDISAQTLSAIKFGTTSARTL